jgi:hypothetical protein
MLRFVRFDPRWLHTAVTDDRADMLDLIKLLVKTAMSLGGEADNTVVLLDPEPDREVSALRDALDVVGMAARREQVKPIVADLVKLIRLKKKTLRWNSEHIAVGGQVRPQLPDLDLRGDPVRDQAVEQFLNLGISFFQEAFRSGTPAAPRVELLARMIVGSERVVVIDKYIDQHPEEASRLLELLASTCLRVRRFGAAPGRLDIVQPFRHDKKLGSIETRRRVWSNIVGNARQRIGQDVGLAVAVNAFRCPQGAADHDRFIVGRLATINMSYGVLLFGRESKGQVSIRPSLLPEYNWIPDMLARGNGAAEFEYSL